MRVDYASNKLKKLCTDEREMQKKRSDITGKLKLRIKALEVARTVGDLKTDDPLGYWHELSADKSGLWSGKLSGNYRLVIRPEVDDKESEEDLEILKTDANQDGTEDTEESTAAAQEPTQTWEATTVMVIEIEDYH